MSNHQHSGSQHGRPYALFALNMALSLVAMYLVMFTMIDTWGDFRNNLNTLYMALTMVAPMGIIMLLTMPGMYPSKRTNLFIHAGLVAVFVLSLAGTRTQTAIDDKQFVASMVPTPLRCHPDVPGGQSLGRRAGEAVRGDCRRPAARDRTDGRHPGQAFGHRYTLGGYRSRSAQRANPA
ncbi:hypothetical protein ACRS9I_24455 [Pseudomonas aeruginosa]